MTHLVTLWHDGNAVLIHAKVAEDLGHAAGARLTDAQLWAAIEANAEYAIDLALAGIARQEGRLQ